MQQVGGALGLSILVTIFGSASKHAAAHLPKGLSAAQAAKHIYVIGADRAFWTAAVFLIGVLGLVIFAIRPKPTAAYVDGTPEDAEMINDLVLEM
jgi:hypothetical protein